MKEYSSLSDWLRLAEKAADSPRSAHVLFVTAKEELEKFESLRTQAGARLVQLDSLTLRNRILTRLFDGAMRSRLVGMARDCGQRWDRLHGTIESVCRRLKVRGAKYPLLHHTDVYGRGTFSFFELHLIPPKCIQMPALLGGLDYYSVSISLYLHLSWPTMFYFPSPRFTCSLSCPVSCPSPSTVCPSGRSLRARGRRWLCGLLTWTLG
uniref:Uncharacterized protein n=1 Tax=Hucho hucho TaxID=62062 RepID=A0A4W5RCW9_9TELE